MIPIFEQGNGRGFGLGLNEFIERFDAICAERLQANRAASFAFIFYDFDDRAFKRLLKDQGVFAQLDRLIRDKMSVFFMHSSRREGVEVFNTHFFERLSLAGVTLPCVVFFEFRAGDVGSCEAVCLDQANLIHGFHELYGVIESRIERKPHPKKDGQTALKWVRASGKFMGIEGVRAALREGFQYML